MIKKVNLLRVFALLLALVLCTAIFTGCISGSRRENEINNDEREVLIPPEDSFDLFMEEMFADWVTSDAISLNYFLADPESRNIQRPESTYGEVVNPELIEQSKKETQEIKDRLSGFEYDELRYDQKIVYDILQRNIEISEILDKKDDFNYYTGYIRPLTGFQVQLPVLLAEFSFYTAADIEIYLDILSDTKRYFNDVIEFERERSRRGFFLSDNNVDSICEHIISFLENREDNLLITVFNNRIDEYEGLTDEQREDFKERNKELVLENVLVAYDTLLSAMQELKGVGVHDGGLAGLPDGAEFAQARLRYRVGTDKTPGQLDSMYDSWLHSSYMLIMETLYGSGNNEILDDYLSGTLGDIPEGTAKTYIFELQRHIKEDFPPIGSTGLDIIEVHESLQEHMSPAFYLTPAIDRFNENVVYINPVKIRENLNLFTILAHESYPGHMYQTVYFLQQKPHPLRVALANSGYSEGWATYAEMNSYFFALDDFDAAVLIWELRFFDLLLQGYADLGVNVLGWSLDEVIGLLERFNIYNNEVAQSIFDMVTGIPLNSVMYSVGFMELIELLRYAEELQGRDFELIEFHRFFLEFGSAPFSLIRQYLTEKIENGQLNTN